jgi:hypothetical protein
VVTKYENVSDFDRGYSYYIERIIHGCAEIPNLFRDIMFNTNVVNGLKNVSSYEFIGEVILKINVV